ncbi:MULTISPECIES: hypothetical protein [unclassified Streptomyces]|uniref:hypothetical protein n=1 Tax=unclassified Streptomyces TaxID=2593676 RepID=UPI001BE9B118|nr:MULTISPECIES: hypothetical protein [unclassified Streptomyces]MBT2405123.1 hypothetical protein [Streptomyces sp. ISL-21]MBT2610891.1 hypothetical protein [Streptomyces sp. ISL-87]
MTNPGNPGNPGNPYARLAAAAAEWDELHPRLAPAALDRLALLLAALRTADGEAAERAALLAARLLGEQLPDRFPGESRLAAAPEAPAAGHLGFSADDLAVLVLDGHRMVGPVLGEVRDRLLAAPSVGDAEALEGGCDPYAPGLIRLHGAGGLVRLPAFQFTADGRPRAVVLEVNALLDADHDPWAAADWWLSPNVWLDDTPARLLGTPQQQRLVTAAQFLIEGE